MKKSNLTSAFGRLLNRDQMKNVKGGVKTQSYCQRTLCEGTDNQGNYSSGSCNLYCTCISYNENHQVIALNSSDCGA
ncbi:hypothetical protein SAMN05421821_101221 [Mucilaginibacter lappiensis]|uniref:Uncharacterized protein n=1 Tax=Mucilaginibacter lappiensis TaxID=354630 RepID=A0A1N6NR26_9SPHI|nr:hypothetical protein [Mucilaginibacter lappiensis]MBB6126063.1 hypothetical protein [Mucilaginibacter lappiensis]SIP94457.1 hypothetical protein SAMN05421821_101221 [Mucilaginibacter lappiensis]